MSCGNSNQQGGQRAAQSVATAGTPPAAGGSTPAVFRATEEQYRDGLRRMAPGLDETARAHMAATIKAANDRLMNRQPPPGPASSQPTAYPPPRVVNEHLINLQRPTRMGRWWSFVRAVLPWWLGLRPSRKVIAARKEACLRGGPDKTPCEFIVQQGLFLGCGACGCPARPTSDLGNRILMPLDRCAMGNWPGQTPVIPRKEPPSESPPGSDTVRSSSAPQSKVPAPDGPGNEVPVPPAAPENDASASPVSRTVHLFAADGDPIAQGFHDRLTSMGIGVIRTPVPAGSTGPYLYDSGGVRVDRAVEIEKFIAREAVLMGYDDGRATRAAGSTAVR